MMRSLYSGVAGLKTHQTKMDVIGNNIANTNTVGFKSSSVNFSDTFYQTVSSATGANADLGTAGTNAKQIGLGSMVASITTNITDQGGPSTTNRALDVAINGESFLVVRSGSTNYFTKSGALNVDEAGNLYCTTNGATVQGWAADENGTIIKDTVKDLAVMNAQNSFYKPEATTAVTITGNIDPDDPDVDPTADGEVLTYSFYDKLGDTYTVKMSLKQVDGMPAGVTPPTGVNATNNKIYAVSIMDVLDSESNSIFVKKTVAAGVTTYAPTGASFTFGSGAAISTGTAAATNVTVNASTGEVTMPTNGSATQYLAFSTSSGDFTTTMPTRTNAQYNGKAINFSIVGLEGTTGPTGNASSFPQHTAADDQGGLNIYFDSLTQYSKGGTSKLSYEKGDHEHRNTGNKTGKLSGISIDSEGKIQGTYDNGLKKCLGQMAVATFSNPSGLESVGNSLFAETLNSGAFDGVGEEIALSGSFTVGALEMSNVDLANEFTQMITTQRGFQANSRIITTSDSMLEELVNLKR